MSLLFLVLFFTLYQMSLWSPQRLFNLKPPNTVRHRIIISWTIISVFHDRHLKQLLTIQCITPPNGQTLSLTHWLFILTLPFSYVFSSWLDDISPTGIYLLKVKYRSTRTSWETWCEISFWCLYCLLWTYFTPFTHFYSLCIRSSLLQHLLSKQY